MKQIESKELNLLARNLCWLRRENGISKTRMARILRIGLRSMNRIENGELPPGLNVTVVLNASRFFHVRAADLMGMDLSGSNGKDHQDLK